MLVTTTVALTQHSVVIATIARATIRERMGQAMVALTTAQPRHRDDGSRCYPCTYGTSDV